jgi:hypothetical protein
MTDPSFAAFWVTECSIKSPANISAGYAASTLTDLLCAPLMPVSADTAQRLDLKTPHTKKETTLDGANTIRKGDKLIIDSIEYPIIEVETVHWFPTASPVLRLIVEDIRNR